ncbi:unnamed protein product (macronuclear) [Paramecium tetraurelia]|uniref:Large ribosomal subunit protein uL11 C-terminal domain-containing protein n=1 Tax=Paramecium tetraurelia TaxID=5888 RepID=A0DAU7_PARTE|nr:uncharacterized protein GSPATT00015071001 [Paramecium tetraurelia]CAK80164.1 unnamed protein product [Paramecium tetraurelia]|eukprot:XP_001447561.1 hypothetical protein (macronuclear) [Paramecium tetraurelia strain d4-2]
MPPKVDPNEVRLINIKVVLHPHSLPSWDPLVLIQNKLVIRLLLKVVKWKGIRVMVNLRCQNRNADVTVIPTSSALLIKEIGGYERDRKKTKNVKHNGNLTLEQVIKVARAVEEKSLAKTFTGTVKQVLGTAQSLGATVDGQPVKAIIGKINSGELKVEK